MSVHTPFSEKEIKAIIESYSIGELISYQGITAGITNTLYKIETSQDEYILTLFEELNEEDSQFFANLLEHLYKKGVPCARVISTGLGEKNLIFKNKPLVISKFLQGKTVSIPSSQQCRIIGSALADLHLATQDIPLYRANPYTFQWHVSVSKKVLPHLNDSTAHLLKDELEYQAKLNYSALPHGIIHRDLYPENTLFTADKLEGMIDFNFSCNDYYLFDLAVTMNGWSLQADRVVPEQAELICQSYQEKRLLSEEEKKHLTNMRRYAALHYWVKRLRDKYLVANKDGVTTHPPEQMQMLLCSLI